MNSCFLIEHDEKGYIRKLIHKDDLQQMNWAAGEVPWGETSVPEGIEVSKTERITPEGTFEETYSFQNNTGFPIYFRETDVWICLSLPDRYEEAGECLKRHCHTHLWCGGEISWMRAVRMSGTGPHLGMLLKEGSLRSYSIRRNPERLSNDRGSFLIHPDMESLFPGEVWKLTWEWFWFDRPEEFEDCICSRSDGPIVTAEQFTCFAGETIRLRLRGRNLEEISVSCREGAVLQWEKDSGETPVSCTIWVKTEKTGEYHVDVEAGRKKTTVRIYASAPLEQLMEKRCFFLAGNQQETRGMLAGAYLIYDNETKRRYYSHLDDHNGGRERLAMGALMALWLQEHPDPVLEESLEKYIQYVSRELFDDVTGEVFNDVNRNNDWDRLYNYPWMAVFWLEVYRLRKEAVFLRKSYRVLQSYYQKRGAEFYAIGLPMEEVIEELHKKGMKQEKEEMENWLLLHADNIRKNGLRFPKSEVNYEQSIVAPAVSILLQAYDQSSDAGYLEAAGEMMQVLELFNGDQPDYHLYQNAIRHWDGYWFGKRRCFGDTFPHYWSVLTGVARAEYCRVTKDEKMRNKAAASFLGCLCLFQEDGSASCAFVYPESVNGRAAGEADPWANDQDWALYYAWKYRGFLPVNGMKLCPVPEVS